MWDGTSDDSVEQKAKVIGLFMLSKAMGCGECCGSGWLHMTNGSGERVIQRDDACKRLGGDDEAVERHREECGCGWALNATR